jgi:hypothetical protein
MHARRKFLDLVGVARFAFLPGLLACRLHVVRVAVAACAGVRPQHFAVDAFRNHRSFLRVAGGAFNFGNFLRVRIILDVAMAIAAGKHSVNAGFLVRAVDVQIAPFIVLEIFLTVAGKAIHVRRMRSRQGRGRGERQPERRKKAEECNCISIPRVSRLGTNSRRREL